MRKLLFVCTGNTCRSPMAQGLAASWLKNKGVAGVLAESAGLATMDGLPASEHAVLALREYGIDISAHRSRQLLPSHLEEAELVAVMTASMGDVLRRRFPAHSDKIITLLPDRDVSDPYGGSPDDYRETRDLLADALPELLSRFLSEGSHE